MFDDGVEQSRGWILHSLVASAVVGCKRVVLDLGTKDKEEGERELEACLAFFTGWRFSSRHILSQNLLDYSRGNTAKVLLLSLCAVKKDHLGQTVSK